MNRYAGELGYYQFEECGEATNPVLGLDVGKTYEFVKKDADLPNMTQFAVPMVFMNSNYPMINVLRSLCVMSLPTTWSLLNFPIVLIP